MDCIINGTENQLTQIAHQITKILQKLFIVSLSETEDLSKIGMDSLQTLELIKEVNAVFNTHLSFSMAIESQNIKELAYVVLEDIKTTFNTSIESVAPSSTLSLAQKSLIFLDEWYPIKSVYNVYRVYCLKGQLDFIKLKSIIHHICCNNDALGMHYTLEQSFQISNIVSIETITRPTQTEVNLIIQQTINTTFDLYSGPLIKFQLIELQQDLFYFVIVAHHSILDGWSINLLLQQINALYSSSQLLTQMFCAVHPSYADFTQYQETYFNSLSFLKEQRACMAYLKDCPIKTTMSANHAALHEGVGHMLFLSLTKELSQKIIQYEKKHHQITVFQILLSALHSVVYRYTQQTDQVIGVVFSGRNNKIFDKTLGYFANILPLRLSISSEDTFDNVALKVSKSFSKMTAFSNMPFEKITESLNLSREKNRHLLFQITMNYQEITESLNLGEQIVATEHLVHNDTAKFDLMLWVWREKECLRLGFEYAHHAFTYQEIHQFVHNYLHFLNHALQKPSEIIGEISIFSELEYKNLLNNSTGEIKIYDYSQSISRLFEQQATLHPNKRAILDENICLSFNELNHTANQLAHHLKHIGVSAKQIIGVCLPRGWQAIVSFIALLKLGATYCPLDPEYPEKRIQYMLDNSDVSLVIFNELSKDKLTHFKGQMINIEQITPCPISSGFQNLNILGHESPDAILYLLYTSGSSGKPKGVLGTVRGFLNRCYWMWETYPFDEKDICCQKTALNFVDSLWEILGPLLQGVSLVIVKKHILLQIHHFLNYLNQEHVTRLVLVPSFLNILLEEQAEKLQHLQLCICSGEALPLALAKKFHATYPHAKLLNLYGSTEVSGDVSYYEFEADKTFIPIGKPISNTQIYVLDAYQQPTPIGFIGDIYAGGDGLAQGYWQMPAETQQKFIANPFSTGTMYHLGDVGRYHWDGNLEYLGRSDQQVKIRGMRIELREIENVLLSNPNVKQAFIAFHEQDTHHPLLIAYVILKDKAAHLTPYQDQQLLNFLKTDLPSMMVPNSVVVIDSFPQLPNGKVDTTQLITFYKHRHIKESTTLITSTTEKMLTDIYCQLLKIENIPPEFDFFMLGGNSLLMIQLIQRIKAVFQISIDIRDIFDRSSIAVLARYIEEIKKNPANTSLSSTSEKASNMPLLSPLSWNQRQIFIPEILSGNNLLNIVSLCFYFPVIVDLNIFKKTLDIIVSRHEALRTKIYQDAEGTYYQEVVPITECRTCFNFIQFDHEQEAEIILSELINQAFDLNAPPLLRVTIIAQTHQSLLCINAHHLITDGWSIRLLCKEINVVYHELLRNQTPLEYGDIGYTHYIAWQKNYLNTAQAKASLDFWSTYISKAKELLLFEKKQAEDDCTGSMILFSLTSTLAYKLDFFTNHFNNTMTLNMVFLSIYYLTIWRYYAANAIGIFSTIAARTNDSFFETMGCFVNTVLLYQELTPDMSYEELISGIKNDLLDIYYHQDMPMSYIFTENKKSISPKNCFPTLVFIFQNFDEPVTFGNTQLNQKWVHNGSTKGDLTIWVWKKDHQITMGFEYNHATFDEKTIIALVQTFLHFTQTVVTHSKNTSLHTLSQTASQTAIDIPFTKNKPSVTSIACYKATQWEAKLIELWNQLFNVQNVTINDDFFDLGGDSLLAIKFLFKLHSLWGTELSYRELEGNSILKHLANFLAKSDLNNQMGHIVSLNDILTNSNLFLIHPISNFSHCYTAFANKIGTHRIYGISQPDVSAKKYLSIHDMAKDYVSLIKEIQKKGPYIIGGWSFGGIVAYEMARQLSNSTEQCTVYMFDSFNISAFETIKPWTDADIIDHLQLANHETHSKDLKILIENIRHNNALLRQYQPQPLLKSIIYLIKATTHSDMFELMQKKTWNGWEDHLHSKFYLAHVNISHEEMFSSNNTDYLVTIMNDLMSKHTHDYQLS